MKPGTRWIYRSVETGSPPQEVVIVVTTATKKLANGVTARVVRDTASSKGQIIEDTLDWYAQDSEGNVWYMGEDTAEFEKGKIVSREGSWEAGVGVLCPASSCRLNLRSARSIARNTRRAKRRTMARCSPPPIWSR